MAESWFSLSRDDQAEALEFAASRTGRPAHLLEKDIWVVWVLSAIYESDLVSSRVSPTLLSSAASSRMRLIDRLFSRVLKIRQLAKLRPIIHHFL